MTAQVQKTLDLTFGTYDLDWDLKFGLGLVNFWSECLFYVQIGFADSLQLAEAGLGIVLEVNNRDAMSGSWSAHVIGCIVPSPLFNIEFVDGRNGFIWFSIHITP